MISLPVWLLLLVAWLAPAWFGAHTAVLIVGVGALSVAWAAALRNYVRFPLNTIANLLEALREGDFSLRGTRARRGDPLGEVILEVNTLAQTLRTQRLRVEETLALLSKILAAIELPILAFDDAQRVRLLNPAAGRLLAIEPELAKGKSAAALGLADCLGCQDRSTLKRAFAGAPVSTWELRLAEFREAGRPQTLLVINDLSRALRREELLAWQRLLRVLGHEINNSLAPISSIAASLLRLLSTDPLPHDWREDTHDSLKLVGERADALSAELEGQWLSICVRDEGLGLASSDNLFVPFYTTKAGGSGIGLVLARAIAEGHGGQVSLCNREDRSGCVARLVLPVAPAAVEEAKKSGEELRALGVLRSL